LPDAARASFKQLLREYIDLRSKVAGLTHDATAKEASEFSARSEAIHGQMWNVVKENASTNPPVRGADSMFKSLIDVMAFHRSRMFGWESRVPDSVICLLLLGCVAGTAAIGLSGGLGNHRGLPARFIVTVLLCATIYVVLDLDRPHEGLISISQRPILHLQQIVDRDPEAKP
jgi:hypothetical protein